MSLSAPQGVCTVLEPWLLEYVANVHAGIIVTILWGCTVLACLAPGFLAGR